MVFCNPSPLKMETGDFKESWLGKHAEMMVSSGSVRDPAVVNKVKTQCRLQPTHTHIHTNTFVSPNEFIKVSGCNINTKYNAFLCAHRDQAKREIIKTTSFKMS